ncbi:MULTISPECIES: gliding motility-associated C-terminal domain-containing protein [unclassified Imperialibacter]|uniref:T9SS type B sorting domain-containing protein n=1 Tax=unclassified Imperialibacter TaxID=2629706 RepID=UPI00125BC703|nr:MULTISPECIES: gliding motility-associated C-terminal domain-containing protein [unclassified Imperialibacter]CAD5274482.1 putative Gliding motility-associated-like protein [Imperialibacter sp. 89]CAD5282998.1 putative Gliding motility-associated-like protein [Imperialibacter sp. 75]VVT22361.1 hypothetical protein IMPR6_350039 [Imperialibacter sp. EC-SDR9]
MKNLVLLLFACTFQQTGWAQLVNNKSFEGANRPNRPPAFWYPCSSESTPDTQPFSYGVTLPADDGNTYIGIVTRSLPVEPFEVREDMETRLNLPMIAGFPYVISVSLAHADSMGYDDNNTFIWVNRPIKLTVYGGTESCLTEELLWESPLIDNTEWIHFEEVIRPEMDNLRYLVFVATPEGNRTTNGNILIDNFNLIEEPLIIPTAFTPNGDGFNDQFFIKGIKPLSSLKVVSRDGDIAFETEDYQNDWAGGDWPSGVYFYTLTNSIKGKTWKGEVSIIK